MLKKIFKKKTQVISMFNRDLPIPKKLNLNYWKGKSCMSSFFALFPVKLPDQTKMKTDCGSRELNNCLFTSIVNFIQKNYPQISHVKNFIQKFYPKFVLSKMYMTYSTSLYNNNFSNQL